MAKIVVYLGALEEMVSCLDDTAELIHQLSHDLDGSDVAETGHPGLSKALDDFNSQWRHGLSQIATAAWSTGDRLGMAVMAYDEVEGAVSGASR